MRILSRHAVLSGLVVTSLLLGACAAETSTPEPTTTAIPTIARTATPDVTPTLTPTTVPATATPTEAPVVAPPRIAWVKGDVGSTDIYIADVDGSNPVCVACEACDQAEPAWSPDGTQIIYQSNCGDTYDLWVVNADGSGRTQLTDTPNLDEREPDWSPDGERIVYRLSEAGVGRNANGPLMVMGTDANDVVSLDVQGRAPKWSPDGKSIAYMSETNGDWEIYIFDEAERTTNALSSCTHSCRWPDWSPEGDKVIFHDTTAVGSIEVNAIWTSPVSAWSPNYVLDGASAGRPVWSSSGTIAFNSNNGIETANLDGSGRLVLISGTENWAPAWSH